MNRPNFSSFALDDAPAAKLGRAILQLVYNEAPLPGELAKQIDPILKTFPFELAQAVLVMRGEKVTVEELQVSARHALEFMVEDVRRTFANDGQLAVFRVGTSLVLTLDCLLADSTDYDEARSETVDSPDNANGPSGDPDRSAQTAGAEPLPGSNEFDGDGQGEARRGSPRGRRPRRRGGNQRDAQTS